MARVLARAPGAQGSWRSAAAALERRFPDRRGLRQHADLTVAREDKLSELSEAELDRRTEEIVERVIARHDLPG